MTSTGMTGRALHVQTLFRSMAITFSFVAVTAIDSLPSQTLHHALRSLPGSIARMRAGVTASPPQSRTFVHR
jgi:hypothetical protein